MTNKQMLEEILQKLGFIPEQVINLTERDFDAFLVDIPNIQDYWKTIDDLRMYRNYVKTMEDITIDIEKSIKGYKK